MLAEFKSLMEAADALEKKQPPSRPISLDEAMKLKAFCDVYLGNRARNEVQKAVRHLHQAMPVPQQLPQISILRTRYPNLRKVR